MSAVPVRRSGRGWAYAGVVLGAAVSVAANVAHSYVPPQNASPGWVPEAGAVVSAIFWPLLLLVAVEVSARTGWPPGKRWLWLRFGGLGPVAVIAAVVSYRHLSGLLTFYGEDAVTALIGPVAVDGLMLMATGALIAGSHRDTSRAPAVTDVPARDTKRGAARRSQARTDRATSGTGIPQRTDTELEPLLKRVRRDADGTVPIRRATRELGIGPGRARRLLADAGLLRTGGTADAVPDTSDSDVR